MGLERTPEQLIKAGLAALKKEDYGRAIATFQQLHAADGVDSSYRTKAQMGLIRTYEAQGNYGQASTLCQPLLQSRSQAIRQWAQGKLQQLNATDAPSAPTTASPAAPSSVAAPSGFIPFTATEPPHPTPRSQTTSSSKQLPDSAKLRTHPPTSPSEAPTTPGIGDSPSTEPSIAQVQGPSSSLFHYQSLNNNQGLTTLGAERKAQNSPPPRANSQQLKTTQNLSRKTSPKPELQQSKPKSKPLEGGPSSWPPGERLTRLKSLGKVNIGRLWLAQLVTLPLFFIVVRWLVQTGLMVTRTYFRLLDQLLPFINIPIAHFFWEAQTWRVLIGLGLLTVMTPWLWSWWLRPLVLTPQQLKEHSPEAYQLLHRFCTKHRWPVPPIQLLASEIPLIFSYGWHPRNGKLVVSQGLLECLTADELAAVVIYEMGHWSKLDWIFFSTHGALSQGFHRGYWFLAHWGRDQSPLLRITAGTLASLSYAIFKVLTWVGSGLARTRVPYRDRTAAELTGNPNGLVRALGKLSAAMTHTIEKQGYTPPFLESLELMLPVGTRDTKVSIQHLAWGAFNPLRHWLSFNQGHPPLGDRLYTLGTYSRHWQLKPSLNFARLQLKHSARTLSSDDWKDLLLQGGAWSGLIIGLGIAMGMWLLGAIATQLNMPLLSWLYKDRSILLSMPLIGSATGHLLRVNPFFPDINASMPPNDSQLTLWQTDPTLIPLSSLPIKVNGTLTGRPALANWLGQEWRLHTPHGSIRLHYIHYLGPLSNIKGLARWLHQPLQITGWFRHGHHTWIDVDRLSTHQGQIKQAQHPTWAIIISAPLLIYGLQRLFQGG